MDVPGITLTFQIGPEILMPASADLSEALSEITITQADQGPSSFQLVFNADRTSAFLPDYPMLLQQQIRAGLRVGIAVTIPGSLPKVLMDGFISNIQLSHDKAMGTSTITATGEDVGISMDRTENSRNFPALGDYEIVNLLLLDYALYGVIPMVIPTLTGLASDPLEGVPIQPNMTDRQYINHLAETYGNIFLIRPGPTLGLNQAYWGPPIRVGLPQPPLSVDMGPATNVESINFTFDATVPVLYDGIVQDKELETDLPVMTLLSTRLPPLALQPAVLFNGGMRAQKIYDFTGETIEDAFAHAQGLTDASVDNAVTASGEVDTLRYGAILSCPGLAQLRGAGLTFDGLYMVRSVTHSIKRGQYRQQFQLAREGLMSTLPMVLQ